MQKTDRYSESIYNHVCHATKYDFTDRNILLAYSSFFELRHLLAPSVQSWNRSTLASF